MVIGESNGFAVQSIQVRCLKDRISMTRKVSVTLIISQNDNNIRLVSSEAWENCQKQRKEGE